jgi:DNA-binding GntR family transcriptional regulator
MTAPAQRRTSAVPPPARMPRRPTRAAPKVALVDKPARPLRKGATDETVQQAIYDAVMDHRLPPGIKLTESAFSAYFGVSRTVVRKALFCLSQKGVVELRPNRGAVVASPTPQETHCVFDARRLIERELIRTLAAKRTKKQIQQLRQLAQRERTAQQEGAGRALVRLTGEFHVRLAQFAGNPVLADLVSNLVSRTSLIIALYEAPGMPACRTHDHFDLIALIEAGNGTAAADAMVQHLTEIENRLDLSTADGPLDLSQVFDAP